MPGNLFYNGCNGRQVVTPAAHLTKVDQDRQWLPQEYHEGTPLATLVIATHQEVAMYISPVTGRETVSNTWILPNEDVDDSSILEVTKDAVGTVITLSCYLPADIDASTPTAALEAITVALSELAATMRDGAA